MKSLRVAGLVVALIAVNCGIAQAAPKVVRTAPPFVAGFYSEQGTHRGTASIEFFVSANGREILGGHKSAGGCDASAALVAQGIQGTAPLSFYFPHSIPISPSGAFSSTQTVTISPYEAQSTVGASGSVTISGHFIKGKIVSYRTNAVVGTFSAPSICATSTPSRVLMQWDINDL